MDTELGRNTNGRPPPPRCQHTDDHQRMRADHARLNQELTDLRESRRVIQDETKQLNQIKIQKEAANRQLDGQITQKEQTKQQLDSQITQKEQTKQQLDDQIAQKAEASQSLTETCQTLSENAITARVNLEALKVDARNLNRELTQNQSFNQTLLENNIRTQQANDHLEEQSEALQLRLDEKKNEMAVLTQKCGDQQTLVR